MNRVEVLVIGSVTGTRTLLRRHFQRHLFAQRGAGHRHRPRGSLLDKLPQQAPVLVIECPNRN
jgi:hypothetical protein